MAFEYHTYIIDQMGGKMKGFKSKVYWFDDIKSNISENKQSNDDIALYNKNEVPIKDKINNEKSNCTNSNDSLYCWTASSRVSDARSSGEK